ncbi:MAG: ABC transporter substrate-binding protein [Actinobacteria bacterium]|nr:ABC transporter substrate-binding protein [Actinomycetota bacterium]
MTTSTLVPPAIDTEFDRIVAELTRRGFLAGTIGAAGLLGLSACGSSGGIPAGSGPAAATTRRVETAKGPVDVPADPKRIVAIQPSSSATLYDLGLTPVGVYDQGASYISPRYRGRWATAPKIGVDGEIDVEKVAKLDPDLILGVDYDWNTKVYSQLTALAPTVIAPSTTWQALAHTTAEAVGRLAALRALQARLASRSAQIMSSYAPTLARYRWAILQGGFDQGQFWVYGPKSDVGVILAGAGVRFATASAQVAGPDNRAVSYERIDTLTDADVIGYYANYDGSPNNHGPQLFAQPGFRRLAAARAGRLVPIPDFLPGGYGDALAVLDELEAGLKRLGASS